MSFTAEEKSYFSAKPILAKYLEHLPKGHASGAPADLDLEKKNEGFTDASQIQYVARVGNYKNHGYKYNGVLKIMKIIMGYEYLWTNIRVIGGAYGCMNNFLRTGESYFVSYRDPNLAKTNEVYEKIPEYVRNFDVDERDMTKYIIGTFGALDTPMNPEAKGNRSMAAYLEHLTYEEIQRERDEILAATPADIRAQADLIQSILEDQCLCVIGNEHAIRSEEKLFMNIQPLVSGSTEAAS